MEVYRAQSSPRGEMDRDVREKHQREKEKQKGYADEKRKASSRGVFGPKFCYYQGF